jgi:hypothetical protein
VGHFLKPGLKNGGERAGFVLFRHVLDVGQVPALFVEGQKPLGLDGRGLEGFPLEDNDCPGKNGKKEEDKQYGLDDQAGIGYELENIHNSPASKLA